MYHIPNRIQHECRVVLRMVHVPQARCSIALSARLKSFLMELVHNCTIVAAETDMCRSSGPVGCADPEMHFVLVRSQANSMAWEVLPLRVTQWCKGCEVPVRDFVETVSWN